MVLKLRAKTGVTPADGFLSRGELERVAASLEVVLPENVQLVHFGMNPPADTSLRWQETGTDGAPAGRIKTYHGGQWQ